MISTSAASGNDLTRSMFDRGEALAIGEEVLRHPTAAIVPPLSDDRDAKGIRRRLAEAVRVEIERRKRLTQVLTYDDVLIRLRDTLTDPVRGPVACSRLQARYEVVLVDEFQDTDPVQWAIMQHAFGTGESTLVLIGDPKQAIYAFRGADVFAYLDAADRARSEATLAVNWRSDQALIEAYDALFAESQLGHEGIAYRTVSAAPANLEARLIGAPDSGALRVRIVHRDDGLVPTTAKGYASLNAARALIAKDLAADAVRLLSSGAEVVARRHDGAEVAREAVRPGHLAVLVRTNRQAALVRDALVEAARAGGDRRCGQRVRDRAGGRVAPPARRPRAPDGARPRCVRGPDRLRRLGRHHGGDGLQRAMGGPALVLAPLGCDPAPARRGHAVGEHHRRRPAPGARARPSDR